MNDSSPPKTLHVVGVDPAPGKGSTYAQALIEDGILKHVSLEPSRIPPSSLRRRLEELARLPGPVLLCWDAPLTGPPPVNSLEPEPPGVFTIRPIERLFRRKDWKVPGISMQGYAACQHWALSRNILGYPRVGPHDAANPFWELVDGEARGPSVKQVVEVHPGLALLFWLAGDRNGMRALQSQGLHYKAKAISETWQRLLEAWKSSGLSELVSSLGDLPIETDDHLDAVIALALGILGASGKGQAAKVGVLGNAATGSLLLPTGPLFEEAESFMSGTCTLPA